jgi:hypothetical protein
MVSVNLYYFANHVPGHLSHLLKGNPFRRLKYRSLQQLLEQKYRLETSEAKGLAEFLLPMLAFEPYKRPNAKDFEHHPWLNGTKPTRPFP